MAQIILAIGIPSGLFLLFLWLIHPDRKERGKCLSFGRKNFAHRGLWDLKQGIPENSLPAFRLAVKHGYGIELDVHLTKDEKLAVFHDDTLIRICGVSGSCEEKTFEELQTLNLSDTGQKIPLLGDVLKIVDGKVPMLIELKVSGIRYRLCEKVMELLSDYPGEFLIESFNPFVLWWFRRRYPEIPRGQLSTKYSPSFQMNPLIKIASTSLVENALSRPHFIAYNHKTDTGLGFTLCRSLYHVPCFAWTVRSEKDALSCGDRYDAIIFEHYLPEPGPFSGKTL
ncbi:MAG: glycerophosphodiester phosphodiesterase family protein [Bilifractor sp.]|jgi:glycerophosphoryl diester phosphodiesterase